MALPERPAPMIEQRGRVSELEGDHVWVRIGGQSGCPACDAGQGCGAGLFGKLLNRSSARVRVANLHNAQPGQGVVLGLDEHAYLALVMRLYGLPLLAGLLGALVTFSLFAGSFEEDSWVADLAAACGGLAGAALVLIFTRRRLPQGFTHLSPTMLETDQALDCGTPDRNG